MSTTLKTEITVPKSVRRKAGFKPGEPVAFKVSGRTITIVPKQSEYLIGKVMRIIKEAKNTPMTRQASAASDKELAAYGAKQAKKVGIKERDIPRIVHESRSRR